MHTHSDQQCPWEALGGKGLSGLSIPPGVGSVNRHRVSAMSQSHLILCENEQGDTTWPPQHRVYFTSRYGTPDLRRCKLLCKNNEQCTVAVHSEKQEIVVILGKKKILNIYLPSKTSECIVCEACLGLVCLEWPSPLLFSRQVWSVKQTFVLLLYMQQDKFCSWLHEFTYT